MRSVKYKRPDGKVIVQCSECNHWRLASDFIIDHDQQGQPVWNTDRICKHCTSTKEPFSPEVREAVEMPKDANFEDVVGKCHCGDGQYKYNGRPSGVCFRCQGDAILTWHDMCRNYVFDLNEALRQMKRDGCFDAGDPEAMQQAKDDAKNEIVEQEHFDESLDEEELEDFDHVM